MKLPGITSLLLVICISLSPVAFAAEGSDVVDTSTIFGKVITGYQGWFKVPGLSAGHTGWQHWSPTRMPEPGRQTFELYPDNREYMPEALANTGYGNIMGDNSPAKLFGTLEEGVMDTHFSWLKEYGIDGVALQRFLGGNMDDRNQVTKKVMELTQKYGRTFYMMYDFSGMSNNFDEIILNDLEKNLVSELDVFSSPRYLHQNGKPILCVWGFGVGGRPADADKYYKLIKTLRDKGYYVIIGVSAGWRDQAEFIPAWDQANMIAPWTVGHSDIEGYKERFLIGDIEYCDAKGIDYQPVIFSGFAWSTWNGGAQNAIPRNRGERLWRMGTNALNAGSKMLYIAMFDEYDEGTNIAKGAEDSFMIPSDQYFLTFSADGTYISSDFYLRLAGKLGEVVRGESAAGRTVPIPYTNGPVFFRTSFEYSDAAVKASELSPAFELDYHRIFNRGATSLKVDFKEGTKVSRELRGFDVNIPVKEKLSMSYLIYPSNEDGRKIRVDVATEDGTTLSDLEVDIDTERIKIGEWNQVIIDFPNIISGKTIKEVIVKAPSGVNCKAYIDDIVIASDKKEFEIAAPKVGVKHDMAARTLHLLGLIEGVSSEKYDVALDRLVTREEALKLIISLLGDRQTAGAALLTSEFTDVSEWAEIYVGYAYHAKIAKGISDKLFGSNETVTAREVLTFILRGLGYEKEGVNVYENAGAMALKIGIYSDSTQINNIDNSLNRDELTSILYNLLFVKTNEGKGDMIIDKLIEKGDITPASKGKVWEPYFQIRYENRK